MRGVEGEQQERSTVRREVVASVKDVVERGLERKRCVTSRGRLDLLRGGALQDVDHVRLQRRHSARIFLIQLRERGDA